MCNNISAWSSIQKTANTICTTPDDTCCTLYGVSTELPLETIMNGSPPPDYNKLKIRFGSHAQVLNAPSPSNTPRSRTNGAIALGATGMLAELFPPFPSLW